MIPDWYPEHPPIYDIKKSYAENATDGPFFNGPIPVRRTPERFFDFLGYEVRSLIGVPAGPLLNANWIALAAKLGYDIPTYKTIRSEAHPGYPLPNIAFVDQKGHQIEDPKNIEELSITHSFGMPSKSPDFLLQDIEKANRSLAKGQVMIVSVVGTPNRGISFGDDFVRTAAMAREAGAKIIEVNFSCPNVKKGEGMLYTSPETVHEYTRAIAKAIHPLPLILKLGVFESAHNLKSVLLAAARGGARGICGINSVSRNVHPPLDAERPTSGICGHSIREEAIAFLKNASQIIQKEKLALSLLGCGGVMLRDHFDELFDAGAEAAMSATGMMWDPYLGARWHERPYTHS
jgi:dihydroorotate dehydrogenase